MTNSVDAIVVSLYLRPMPMAGLASLSTQHLKEMEAVIDVDAGGAAAIDADARRAATIDADAGGAALIDADLRRLAQREASARLTLGRLAKVLLVRQGHHDLGFASVGDYTRERLGLSRSQFYEVAQVATTLRSLPLIEDALVRGTICWTKARQLAGVAMPSTEEPWLAVAAQCTADQLHALIAGQRTKAAASDRQGGPSAPPSQPDWSSSGDGRSEDDDDIDGEPAASVVIRCPQSVRLLWWEVLRLSCRVSGSDLAAWQSAEAIAAEGLSESGWPTKPFDAPWTGWRYPERCADSAVADVATIALPEPCEPDARAQRDHAARMEARHAEAATAEQLDERMRAVVLAMQRIDADLGVLLCRIADGRLHRRLGYTDFGTYCRNALGTSTRKARALVAIERARRRTCSRITSAYRSGLLSWYRCLVILPVLTERTADAWIERAQRVTARGLADEVMWSRMACDAGLLPEPMPPQLGARLEADFRSFVQFRGSLAATNSNEGSFGSALLDAEIRFRAPATVADMFRWAIFARHAPGEPVWVGLMRLLEHACAHWMSLPRHRDPVFERDGWRCAVPGCSSRRNLHDHHVVFRSQGGGKEQDNRVAVCASHHQHGIHRGVVRASGKAGVGLDWELGRRGANGPFLYVSGRGEVYLPGMPSASETVRLVAAQ